MGYTYDLDLSLEGKTFCDLKQDFDTILRSTLNNMEKKDSNAAEITIKLKISLDRGMIPDAFVNGVMSKRSAVIPQIEHKISSVMQIKENVEGMIGGDYELVRDDDSGTWVMRKIVDPQMSMFG